jgi:hypothetical protein
MKNSMVSWLIKRKNKQEKHTPRTVAIVWGLWATWASRNRYFAALCSLCCMRVNGEGGMTESGNFPHQGTCMNVSVCCTTQKTRENTQKLRKLETRQLDMPLLETQVSKGIRNIKETSETSETWQNYRKVKPANLNYNRCLYKTSK